MGYSSYEGENHSEGTRCQIALKGCEVDPVTAVQRIHGVEECAALFGNDLRVPAGIETAASLGYSKVYSAQPRMAKPSCRQHQESNGMIPSEHPECVTPQDTTPPELRAVLGDALAKRKQIILNGATAYREGAAQSDNPFCRQRQANDWQDWEEAFLRAKIHFVGK